MLRFVIQEQLKKTNIIRLIIIFALLLSLYTFLDTIGFQTYKILGDAFGNDVVFWTITLNVLNSFISALTISLTLINYGFNNQKIGGSVLASIGNVFAVVFTGCASCGLSLLGAIGVSTILPAVTPGAIKFKFFALLVILLGLIIVTYIINTSVCSINKRRT